MAQYDGSIRINTQLNTREFERGARGLLSGMERIGSSLKGIIGSLGFGLGIAGLVALGKQAIDTASDIEEVQNVVDTAFGSMSYKMEEFSITAVKQFGISQLSAKQMGSTFMAMGASMVGSMEDASNMAIALTARSADMASFFNKSASETATALKSIYTGETETLKEYGVVMTEVNLQEYAAVKGITKKISAMTQAEKVQLRYNYVMEQTSLAAGDFARTSDSWANQTRILSEQFKELLSILGTGLISVLTPAVKLLNAILTQLIAITKQIGTLISKFLGISMPVSDSQKFASNLEEAADGAVELADSVEDAGKEAKKALAPFDDLNVLSEKSEKETGGALSAGTFEIPEFEAVEAEKEASAFGAAIDGLIEKLRELKDIFMEGFWDGLGDWEYRWESIKESAASIKDSLINIWTDSSVLSAQDGYYNSLLYMLGSVAGSVSSIGLTIGTNLIGGISGYLEENQDRIKEFLVSMFDIGAEISQLIADFSQAFAFVFGAFGSEDAQKLTENLIGIFTDAVMGTLETVGNLAKDILKVFIQPFTDNKEEFRTALEGFLGVLSEVAGTVKEGVDDTFSKIQEVYDEHFKPFFDSVADGLSQLVGEFLEFWNENVQPILDEWAVLFDELWKEHLQPVIDNLIELFGTLADSLKSLWEEMLMPVIEWVIQYVMPILAKVVDFFVKDFFRIFGVVADVVGGIIKVIGGIIKFLTGTFTGDWEKTWDGIVEIFKGIFNLIPLIVETIINSVIDMINGITSGINWATDFIGIPAIPEIPPVSIPRLATGAVIRGGNPFMAILGDQPRGQVNVEAPLDTIKQAVREELSGMNFGSAGVGQTRVVLNINGIDVGEAMLDDLFSVMQRRGYDVSVLGVT